MVKAPPPIGTVQSGYRYNGGDPSVKGSWSWVGDQSAAATKVDPNAPGSGYFNASGGAPKLSPQDYKYMTDQRTAAQTAQSMRADANRFRELNRTRGTGFGVSGVLGNIAAGIDPTYAEMKSISDRITPLQRQAGSGAMSDRDVEMYRSSTVGLGKPGPANGAIAKVIEAGSKRQQDYASFLEEWARRNGGLLGAQEAWGSYAEANPLFKRSGGNTDINPVSPWREWFGLAPSSPAPAPNALRPPAPRQVPAPAAKTQRPSLDEIFGN